MSHAGRRSVLGIAALLVACSGGGGNGPAEELADQVARVVASGAEDAHVRLETLGVTVARAELEGLEGDDLRCPPVDDAEPGDRATCELFLGPAEVLVDVEFGDGATVTVIGLEVRQVVGGDPDVEAAVVDAVVGRLGDALGGADVVAICPGVDELEPGVDVRCRVAVDGGAELQVDFAVGEEGTLELTTAVLDRSEVEAFLGSELEEPAQGPVEVDCGDEPVLAGGVGGGFACEAVRTADGETFDVVVEIVSVDGELGYEVQGR